MTKKVNKKRTYELHNVRNSIFFAILTDDYSTYSLFTEYLQFNKDVDIQITDAINEIQQSGDKSPMYMYLSKYVAEIMKIVGDYNIINKTQLSVKEYLTNFNTILKTELKKITIEYSIENDIIRYIGKKDNFIKQFNETLKKLK